jgi:hypothetical protein
MSGGDHGGYRAPAPPKKKKKIPKFKFQTHHPKQTLLLADSARGRQFAPRGFTP